MSALAHALLPKNLPQLATLSLAKNEIGDAGAAAFARVAEAHPSWGLEDLFLFGNRIGDVGAEAFVPAVLHALPKLIALGLDCQNGPATDFNEPTPAKFKLIRAWQSRWRSHCFEIGCTGPECHGMWGPQSGGGHSGEAPERDREDLWISKNEFLEDES